MVWRAAPGSALVASSACQTGSCVGHALEVFLPGSFAWRGYEVFALEDALAL